MSSEPLRKNIPINPLMKIPSIPTFGIYDSDSYILMEQMHIIQSENIMPKNLPLYLIEQIKILSQKHPKIIPEFFHITLNANEIYSNYNERNIGTDLVRINLVAHPYIFNNINFKKSSRTHINCAIFKSADELDVIQESYEEKNNILINPKCDIISPELNREIRLEINEERTTMKLEPNNCAFLLNLNSRITNFYCIVMGTHNNIPTKCFIGNYVIITNGLDTSILNSFLQKLINYNNKPKDLFLASILNQMLYNDSLMFIIFFIMDKIVNKTQNKVWNINEIKDLFINGYKIFFEFEYDKNKISQKEHENDLLNICNYYFNHIKNYINYLYYGSSDIANFSENLLLNNISNKYILEIIRKYIDFHLSLLHNTIYSYFGYYSQEIDFKVLKEEAKKIHKTKIWPKYKENFCNHLKISTKDFDRIILSFVDKNWKKIENQNIKIFKDICKALLEDREIEPFLDKIGEPIREYFFYYIWVYKGKLRGIHKDFGRLSFICSDKIKSIYHSEKNEKFNFCEKMIEVITQADARYNQQEE